MRADGAVGAVAPEPDILEGDEAGQRRGEGRGPGRPEVVTAVCIIQTYIWIIYEVYESIVHQRGHLFEIARRGDAALRPLGRRERSR